MQRRRWALWVVAALSLWVVPRQEAEAKPVAPPEFCAVYPQAPACASGAVSCELCHTSPPARNSYGAQLEAALLPGASRPLADGDFLEALGEALQEIEGLDADGDGVKNLEELLAGSWPADAASAPGGERVCPEGPVRVGWDVCRYDQRYVWKKLHLDFCGRSPSLSETKAFLAQEDRLGALHAALDRCLDGEHWLGRDGVVWNLANRKILPAQSIKSGEDEPGPIPLADYLDDYNYFVYTQLDNRDARLLLTGDFYVAREDGPPTKYTTFNRTPTEDYSERGFGGAQLVNEDARAGMLTHRWFLMSTIMFTAVPRTSAAQAYRAYLGYDIARLEGLEDVPNEPVDYDQKDVKADACARCHSTLDPLTYPFTRYEGIGGGDGRYIPFSYNPARLQGFVRTEGEAIQEVPEAGVLFGQPVANLVEWGEVASNSDAFARATVLDYWELLLGERPRGSEEAEFTQIWQDFRGKHEYGVERMLHALIETEAYGVP
jgi:hypothetical protein